MTCHVRESKQRNVEPAATSLPAGGDAELVTDRLKSGAGFVGLKYNGNNFHDGSDFSRLKLAYVTNTNSCALYYVKAVNDTI
jgi:hypothetical protein